MYHTMSTEINQESPEWHPRALHTATTSARHVRNACMDSGIWSEAASSVHNEEQIRQHVLYLRWHVCLPSDMHVSYMASIAYTDAVSSCS